MTLLPSPGKPGFYGVGLPGRVILCQPCPKVWPIMNTAVTNDIKILANTLLTQIEPPNRDCFGRGPLRLSVLSAKFWVESGFPQIIESKIP